MQDWSKPEESPQPKIGSKRKSGKLKRAQKELKKCGFEEAVIKSELAAFYLHLHYYATACIFCMIKIMGPS